MSEEATSIYFDANVFIYAMETDTEQGLLARRWIMQIDRHEVRAVTSELTLGEVLPYPLSSKDQTLVQGYLRLLTDRAFLRVRPVERQVLLSASDLRARFRTELPDAIHVATTLDTGCEAFLTEDDRLKLPPEIKKLALADARYPL